MFKPEEHRMPPWMQSWNKIFSGLQYASEAWMQLIQNWQQLEHDYGYTSLPRCFGESMDIFRVLSKAKFDPTFICDTPSSIASDFWSWWVSRNLPARTRADNGWLVPGSGNDPVEISKLQVPGKNGWLSLLFILMIWRHSISTGDTTKWDLAVIDVNWVTHRLIDSIWYRPSIEDIPTLKRMYTMTGADEEGGHRK